MFFFGKMTTQNKAPVFYLPLGQTVYQKCLVDILIQLHKPHITQYLNRQKELLTRSSKKSVLCGNDLASVNDDHVGQSIMSDESMFEAFIFNAKQITNHPTLLVDHYIPRNLLLLSSKESIIDLSNKYHQVSEILDKLVERNVRKTIVISVSNAKEMDLIESFLLGKCGIQYYRFSGSSLYYDNHGSFDFHKVSKKENPALRKQYPDANGSQSPNIGALSHTSIGNGNVNEQGKQKKKPGRSKKGAANGVHGNDISDSTNGDTKKKKKIGRPTSAEKRAREQQAQLSAALAAECDNGKPQNNEIGKNTHNNDGDEGHKIKENREEYIPKLSKNNREFVEMLAEKRSKKLNVYLILSSQLKYLLQFEDLKSDMVFSLDSNFTDFEDLSNVLTYEVPIIKPIVVDSLEHYEWEMNKEPAILTGLDIPTPKRQRRSATGTSTTNGVSNSSAKLDGENKAKFNRLLALLSIASWSHVEVESQSTLSPVSNKIIDWLVDWKHHTYPYGDSISTLLPHTFDDLLVDKVLKALDAPYDLTNTLGVNEMDQYEFFNPQLNADLKGGDDVGDNEQKNTKRIKLSPKLENVVKQIPDKFTYQQYQLHLTSLIDDTLQAMLSWMKKTERCLQFVHLDETERQSVIDQGYVECGELFKKDRDLGVKIEARDKIRHRLENEHSKLITTNQVLHTRYDAYTNIKNEDIELVKQEQELEDLRSKLEALNSSLRQSESEAESIRQIYQEKSSHAAELSLAVKQVEELGKTLREQSEGTFRKIQVQSLYDQQAFDNKQIAQLNADKSSWNGYIEVLQVELNKRTAGSNTNGDGYESTGRSNGRGRTPH